MTVPTQSPEITESPNAVDADKFIRMEETLIAIRDAHRFNVAAMPAHAVHALCFNALEDDGSE